MTTSDSISVDRLGSLKLLFRRQIELEKELADVTAAIVALHGATSVTRVAMPVETIAKEPRKPRTAKTKPSVKEIKEAKAKEIEAAPKKVAKRGRPRKDAKAVETPKLEKMKTQKRRSLAKMTRKGGPEGVTARAMQWFKENPGTKVTANELIDILGLSQGYTLRTILYRLVDREIIQKVDRGAFVSN